MNLKSTATISSEDIFMSYNRDGTNTQGWSTGIDSTTNDFHIAEDGDTINTNVRLCVEAGGNVGIGTVAPGEKLDVVGNIKTTGIAKFYHSTSHYGSINANSEGLDIDTVANRHMRFKQAGTEVIRINTSGNVGIGTTSPAYKLDVNGSARIGSSSQTTTSLYLTATNTDGASAMAVQTIMQGYETRGQGTFHTDTSKSGEEWFSGINYAGQFDRWSVGYDLAGGQAEYLANAIFTVFHNGNVGIGTTSPSQKFEVNGGNVKFATTDSHQRLFITSEAASQSIIYFGDAASSSQGRVAYDNSSDDMYFNTSTSEKLRIKSNGNIGIGTSSPSTKLEVNGTTHLGSGGNDVTIGASNSSVIHMLRSGYNYLQASDASGSLMFRTGGANNRMIISSAGNVGIGTTSPSEKLDVVGNVAVSGTISSGAITSTGAVQASSYKIAGTTVLQGATNITIGSSGATGTISLTTHTSTPLKIENDDTITISSNVTAGSNSLTAGSLDINGNADISGNLSGVDTLTAQYGRFTSTGDASVGGTTHAFQTGTTASTNIIIDDNEIMARNNGAVAGLNLNPDGGNVTFHNNGNASTIDASGNATFAGNVDVSGNILPGITIIKILPRDFIADDSGRPVQIDDSTSGNRHIESDTTSPLFASVEIPPGFKATHVDIYGDGTSAVTVYEADINVRTVTSKGTGNIGTQINITDVTSDATNYLLIELAQASGEQVNGGKVTIAKA